MNIKLHPFPNQTSASIYKNYLQLREVKIFNQFSPLYLPLISKHEITDGICGYIAPAVAIYLSMKIKNLSLQTEIDIVLEELNKPEIILEMVEKNIIFIQENRKNYILINEMEFPNVVEQKMFMRDLVAYYEISSSLMNFAKEKGKDAENIYFFRMCQSSFPDFQPKYMEAKCLKEEEQFKGENFLIEIFYPDRKLQTINDFKKQYPDLLKRNEKCTVLVVDIYGHFVVVLSFFLDLGNRKIPFLLLLNSIDDKCLENKIMEEISEMLIN